LVKREVHAPLSGFFTTEPGPPHLKVKSTGDVILVARDRIGFLPGFAVHAGARLLAVVGTD
jgi:hypothetical protein